MQDAVPGDAARFHAIISGRVQGVNFRAATSQQAHQLGIRGWVRNRIDGSVETIAEGARPQLMLFLEFLRVGPRAASVTHVAISWDTFTGEFARFQIRP